MTAVMKTAPTPGVTISKIPVPEPETDEILVEVVCSSLCGTDVGIYDWMPWAQSHIIPPIVIGHEVVGRVVSVNSEQPHQFKPGDYISSETHIYCGKCTECRNGQQHICANLQLFGIGRNGGFADFATIPLRTAWKNSSSLPAELMSIQEPLGNAVHVLTKAEISGKRVLVLGLGPVGLCASAIAHLYGAKQVVVIEKSEYRRNLAQQLGIRKIFSDYRPEFTNEFDVVLEMSGNQSMITHGFEALSPGGTFIAFGIPKEKVYLEWGEALINKETTIKSVFGRKIWDTWHEVQKILLNPNVDLQPLITHSYSLNEFEDAVQKMKSGECGKIILYPEK